jgi:hypothetical protein
MQVTQEAVDVSSLRSAHQQARKPRLNREALARIEILVLVLLLALLISLLFAFSNTAKRKGQRIGCTNNLKQIGLADRLRFTDEALAATGPPGQGIPSESSDSSNYVARHFRTMSSELISPQILACPSDDRKAAVAFGALQNTNISYFAGLSTGATNFPKFITGDRNLTLNGMLGSGILTLSPNDSIGWTEAIHRNIGNVALADGSVQNLTSDLYKKYVPRWGRATHRLAFPQ